MLPLRLDCRGCFDVPADDDCGLAEERIGLRIVGLGLIQVGQIEQAEGIKGMALAENFLTKTHCLAEGRFGPRIVAFGLVQTS